MPINRVDNCHFENRKFATNLQISISDWCMKHIIFRISDIIIFADESGICLTLANSILFTIIVRIIENIVIYQSDQ